MQFWEMIALVMLWKDTVHEALSCAVAVPFHAWLMQLFPELHLNSCDYPYGFVCTKRLFETTLIKVGMFVSADSTIHSFYM